MSLKKKLRLCREFGVKIVLSDMCATNIRIPRLTSRWKDRVILQWLREHYASIIDKYKNITHKPESCCNSSPVWSMWWQDESNAPDVVKLCLSSMRKNCGAHPFNVITHENYQDYIKLPDYILDKVKSGVITLTHLSDIIRMYLLSHYGGMWIDSTVLVTRAIPDEIFAAEYFTVKRGFNMNDRNAAMKRWTGFLQAAQRNNTLCAFVLDMLLEYWKDNVMLIEYVLIDYLIVLAYEDIPECRRLIDSVPLNNPRLEDMMPFLNSEYDSEVYDELTSDTQFFKLTYKQNVQKDVAGRKTLYARLLESSSCS